MAQYALNCKGDGGLSRLPANPLRKMTRAIELPLSGDLYYGSQTSPYLFTEVLHYEDGSSVTNREELVSRGYEPISASYPDPHLLVSEDAVKASFQFWNDHDPRIVRVSHKYAPVS